MSLEQGAEGARTDRRTHSLPVSHPRQSRNDYAANIPPRRRGDRVRAGHRQTPTDLAAGVAAQYNDVARPRADGTVVRANTLEINPVLGRFDEATVVHECLHAAYDLLRTGLDGDAEEASAYVCTALYCRMTGLPRPRWANGQIYANAELTAQTLLKQYQKGDPGIPFVGEDEWRMLRAGVGLHPVYASGGPAGIITGWFSATNIPTTADPPPSARAGSARRQCR